MKFNRINVFEFVSFLDSFEELRPKFCTADPSKTLCKLQSFHFIRRLCCFCAAMQLRKLASTLDIEY